MYFNMEVFLEKCLKINLKRDFQWLDKYLNFTTFCKTEPC